MTSRLPLARRIALLLPVALLAGALGSQHFGHLVIGRDLYPCEMCLWQRWPHYAAVLVALAGFATAATPGRSRALTLLAAALIAVSGLIGLFHAGVEYGWWRGFTECTSTASGSGDLLADILAAPIVRCDQPQWTLGPISLAGFNALFSIGGALLILWLCRRPR